MVERGEPIRVIKNCEASLSLNIVKHYLAVFVRVWQILVESLMFLAFAFVKPADTAESGNTNAA